MSETRPETPRDDAPKVSPLRAVARLAEITARLTWSVLRLGVRTLVHRMPGRRRPTASLLGEELTALFEALGPTFVKLGQILSSRPDLVSPRVAGPLARLQDDVAPFEATDVPALLEAAFGRPLGEVFAAFESEPVACASIAHVHRARLPDGRDVAVKIRRPGIVERVRSDLALVRTFARAAGRLPFLRVVPIVELVEELAAPIHQQLDFEREAENLRRFRASFLHVEHVTLPRLVDELCTESVLTMEYLDHLEKVTSSRFSAAEKRTAALAGLRALYRMIFLDGFVHADLHPGNVFLRPWGEVVLLDMGLVAELTDDDLGNFVDFFFGLVNDQGEICARILWETALYRTARAHRERFTAAVCELVARHSQLRSREFEVARFVYELIEIQRRSGIRGSTKFIMVVLAMVVFDGICKQLYPECDFQAEARGFLIMAKYRHHQVAAAV